ncbi:unnamed protein product [Amoebophrya sp. A120]|nr:unnamed protein product [Amoebophrya sp. A120]|eukprot:GSA120T00006726001.1
MSMQNGGSSASNSVLHDLSSVLNDTLEEELTLDPYRPRVWITYIDTIKKTDPALRYLMYERALKTLPMSYKLWRRYLLERRKSLDERRKIEQAHYGNKNFDPISDEAYAEVNAIYDRCLIFMHKMPRIWLDYLEFLIQQRRVTQTRRAIDGALRTLPIQQHHRVWNIGIPWVGGTKYKHAVIPQKTCLTLFRRYLMLEPSHVETFIAYLLRQEIYDEAAVKMVEILNDEDFVSINGKSRHQLWLDLCELISKHPREIRSIKIEPIIRQGIGKFTDEVGRLWICLADHFIRLAWFDKARAIYQEAIETIVTAHDFALVYESYEVFLTDWLEVVDERDKVGEELQFAILEDLMDNRPLLLNSVLLRQNPHVVAEWLKRVEIYKERDNLEMVVQTYKEAVAAIDPKKCIGKIQDLWVQFARFFEEQDEGDLSLNVRDLFQEAVKVHFAHADDLASIWCEWIEMELRHDNFQEALNLARASITQPTDRQERATNIARMKSVRSKKLWYLALDLEENFGTFETTKATYEKMIDLKIATPQVIINFAHYLEDRKYFEQAFKVYEKGVTLFKQPHCFDLWLFYLRKFVTRYKAKKLERSRDLFEEAIKACSSSEIMQMRLHVLYGKLEERYGLAKKALSIYQQACEAVHKDPSAQLKMWTLLLVRTGEIKGGDVARNVLKAAVDTLPEGDGLIHFGLLFAELENSFGELARARVIYEHISQYCDPRKYPKFWEIWQTFEMRHGNAETFKEMRRIQRSVEAAYAQVHFNAPDITSQLDELKDKVSLNPMAEAEQAMENAEQAAQQQKLLQQQSLANAGLSNPETAAFLQKRNKLLEELGVNQRERDAFFEPCDTFGGSKLGYVFKTGIKGLGYYEDAVGSSLLQSRTGVISKKAEISAGLNTTGTAAGEAANKKATGDKAANKKRPRILGDEEIDLADLDDEDEEVVEDTYHVPGFLSTADKERLEKLKEEEIKDARATREQAAKERTERLYAAFEAEEEKKGIHKGMGGALSKFQKKKMNPHDPFDKRLH